MYKIANKLFIKQGKVNKNTVNNILNNLELYGTALKYKVQLRLISFEILTYKFGI